MIIFVPAVSFAAITAEQLTIATVAGFAFRRHGEEAIVLQMTADSILFADPAGRTKFDHEKEEAKPGLRLAIRAEMEIALGGANGAWIAEIRPLGIRVSRK